MNTWSSFVHADRTQKIAGLAFFLTIFCVFLLRFLRISEIGVGGSDEFLYWHFAMRWSDGRYGLEILEIDQPRLYRPVSFYLFSWALRVFESKDYAIKIFNILLDACNAYLIFLVCRRLSNQWVGWLASVLYACIPVLITYSRTEFLHTLSIFFLLMAFYFLVRFLEVATRVRLFYLLMAGVALAEGSHVHPSVLLNAPGFFAVIVLDGLSIRLGWKAQAQKMAVASGTLMAGILGVYLILLTMIGMHQHPSVAAGQDRSAVTTNMTQINRVQFTFDLHEIKSRLKLVSVPVAFVRNSMMLSDGLVKALFVLFGAAMLLLLLRLSGVPVLSDWGGELKVHASWMVMLCFAVVFSLFFSTSIHQLRDHLQLLPLFVISVSVTFYAISARWITPVGSVLLLAFFVGLFAWHAVPGVVKKIVAQDVSIQRKLYNTIGSLVDADNRIVFLDNPADRTRPWSIRPYFGEHAIYYNDCEQPLDRFVTQQSIRFLAVPNPPSRYTQNSKIHGQSAGKVSPVPEWTKSCYIRKLDLEKMKSPMVSESGWWHHRVLNASLVEQVIQKQAGEIVFQTPSMIVLMLFGQDAVDRGRALAEVCIDPQSRCQAGKPLD